MAVRWVGNTQLYLFFLVFLKVTPLFRTMFFYYNNHLYLYLVVELFNA